MCIRDSLDVADVTGVGQGVIGSLDGDLLKGADGIVHRHMEGVGVVFPIGHAGDDAILFLVDADKAAAQTLGGGCLLYTSRCV